MTATETPSPVLIGLCVNCKHPFRFEVSPEIAGTIGALTSPCIPRALRSAGVEAPRCHCRDGVRCPEMPNGIPECGDSWCEGHGTSDVRWQPLKVTLKPGVPCSPGGCQKARSRNCICSCGGANHGLAWAPG
jgi:hypothetical protein